MFEPRFYLNTTLNIQPGVTKIITVISPTYIPINLGPMQHVSLLLSYFNNPFLAINRPSHRKIHNKMKTRSAINFNSNIGVKVNCRPSTNLQKRI